RFNGGIPLVSDVALAGLRFQEERDAALHDRNMRRGMKGPTIDPGTEVRMGDGAFAGLSGIVEGQQGEYTMVSIDGFHAPIKIASILLLDENATSCAKAA